MPLAPVSSTGDLGVMFSSNHVDIVCNESLRLLGFINALGSINTLLTLYLSPYSAFYLRLCLHDLVALSIQ